MKTNKIREKIKLPLVAIAPDTDFKYNSHINWDQRFSAIKHFKMISQIFVTWAECSILQWCYTFQLFCSWLNVFVRKQVHLEAKRWFFFFLEIDQHLNISMILCSNFGFSYIFNAVCPSNLKILGNQIWIHPHFYFSNSKLQPITIQLNSNWTFDLYHESFICCIQLNFRMMFRTRQKKQKKPNQFQQDISDKILLPCETKREDKKKKHTQNCIGSLQIAFDVILLHNAQCAMHTYQIGRKPKSFTLMIILIKMRWNLTVHEIKQIFLISLLHICYHRQCGCLLYYILYLIALSYNFV